MIISSKTYMWFLLKTLLYFVKKYTITYKKILIFIIIIFKYIQKIIIFIKSHSENVFIDYAYLLNP